MAEVRIEAVTKRFGAVSAVNELTLRVRDREFVSFLGPSGCGKTTTLNMIAGLEQPTTGSIWIGDRDVTHVPAMHRDAAMVFQSYALYPHMTVAKNLGFALKVRGTPPAEIEARTHRAASMLSLGELMGRYPRQLSGGQRQRVALGRALVRDPQVFLLDEPLSNLDAVLRVQTRAELKRLFQQLGTTTIYVTHDQSEAMTMSDRIAVFSKGLLQQVGAPLEIYRAPRNKFVAGFVGSPPMTFLPAAVRDGTVRSGILALPVPARFPDRHRGRSLVLGLRPEDVRLGAEGAAGTIEIVEHLGSGCIIHVDLAGQRVVAQLPDADRLQVGDQVGVSVAPENLYLFDPDTEQAVTTPGGTT